MHSFQYDKGQACGVVVIGVACGIGGFWFKSSHIFNFLSQDPHSEILTHTHRGCDLLNLVFFLFFHCFHSRKEVIYPPETLYFSSLTDFHTKTEVIYGSQNEIV